MKTAVIMQPTYLPWAGYFDLMDQADVFVYYDDAAFSRRSWHHRNRIRTRSGLDWLTVPVRSAGRRTQALREAQPADASFWLRKHLRRIANAYAHAPFTDDHLPALEPVMLDPEAVSLAEINIRLIEWLAARLGIDTPRVLGSELDVSGSRGGLMADICQRVHAEKCLSPLGSAGYLREEFDPAAAGLEVVFHHYEHPVYRQAFQPFMPYASVLDLLLNEGSASLDILRSGRRQAYGFHENW